MQIEKKDIRAVSKNNYANFVTSGDKAFVAINEWLWSKGAHSFEDMTNISIETRAMLESNSCYQSYQGDDATF
jgi:23S rRNA (adenine2503-C2)-methyltransferase